MDFYHKLLNYFSLDEEQYKNLVRPLSDADVPSPNCFDNMDEATERITKAIANDERIFIYGDYDCDGVLATAILVKTFQMMGYKNYGYYIPSRYIDGYAITLEKVRQAKEKGYSLIITVDNGITKTEEVALANELGMDVIITDHHEMAEILPDAIAVIHPKLSSSPEVVTSGATMSFFLATSLLKKVDHYLLSLAGISIISDLMELKGYNRDIVRLMINYVNNEHYDPIVLLCESSDIDENTIGSKFAPKVNAIGRLIEGTNINRLVKYFACDNKDELVSSASYITAINERRKEMTRGIVNSLSRIDNNKYGIVVNLDIKEGMIGLIANRLLDQYNKPVVVFCKDNKDDALLRGSVRSKEGFDVTKAFISLSRYVIDGGGHALAGGLSIKKSDLDSFSNEFYSLCKTHLFIETEKSNIRLDISDLSIANHNILRGFAPFGIGFDEPVFSLRDFDAQNLRYISNDQHISVSLSKNVKILGFNMPKIMFKEARYVELIGKMRLSHFRNITNLEFRLVECRKSQ